MSGNDEEMKKVLKNNSFPINSVDIEQGNTLLHLAAKRKNVKVVEFLLKQGADPLIKNNDGILPIHVAVEEDAIDVLQAFTDHDGKLLNVKINDKNENKGVSLLHWAIIGVSTNVSMKSIRFLVQKNPDCVNDLCYHKEQQGASVIHLAFEKFDNSSEGEKLKDKTPDDKKSKVIKSIVEKSESEAPKHLKDVTEIIKLFLENCSKEILITDGSGSVLHKLIQMGNLEAIKTIYTSRFENEVEFLKRLSNFETKKKQTPIAEVVRMSNDPSKAAELFKLLLDHGAAIEPAMEAVIEVSDINLLKIIIDHCEQSQRQLQVILI